MKVAHIVPTSCLDMTVMNDYHLVLPHLLVNDMTYGEFYTTTATGHKILDNGVAEGVDFNWGGLVDMAHYIGAQEIVIPDVMGDCDRTIELARKFEKTARRNSKFDYMGVVQGKSYSEIVKCLHYFVTQDWITVLAVPRVLANTIHKDIRANFVNAFEAEIEGNFKAVHFLGASNNIKEVILLSDTMARGIDTSMPAVMGLEQRLIDVDGYVPRQSGFFEAQPSQKQLMHIEHNLTTYVDWARG